MIHTLADDFTAEIAQLAATPVTHRQWATFLDHHVTLTDPKTSQPLTGRARTLAEHKRDTLERLYLHDDRAAPWTNTALGVLQAVNTYDHHESPVRGSTRTERNMLRTISGAFTTLDRNTLTALLHTQAA